MYFLDGRIKVIAEELFRIRIRRRDRVRFLRYKEGVFFHPDEVDASHLPWIDFDSEKDMWRGFDKHFAFRFEVTVPDSLEGRCIQLRVATQVEDWDYAKNPQALAFVDGVPRQGLDLNHTEIRLSDSAEKGRTYTIDLLAWTGNKSADFNLNVFLEELDLEIEGLYYDIVSPLEAFDRLDKESEARRSLERVLNEAVNIIDIRNVYSDEFYTSVHAARAYLAKALYEELAGHDDVICSVIGHTHIDVAWLWTVAQTREKAARSFSTVLELMDMYPSYRFMSSQPVLYTFVKERYPELYERIKDRVAEKRWESEGGMYLEADTNLTSGESLVRQFMFGKRFFREEFGVDNRILWLPDVFGYSAALPQIMKKCGIDYFMTTKVNWNQFDKMPDDTFIWRGSDGSEVLAHLITAVGINQPLSSFFTTYNGMLHGDVVVGSWQRYQNKDINNDILICYGYGDGGGGPTREMLEKSKRLEKGIIGIPKVVQKSAGEYFSSLDRRVRGNRRLNTWEGELYFEYHRGTLTSIGEVKKNNRRCENAIMDAEFLTLLSGRSRKSELDELWKVILLNQFHDILPGSSIKEVYEDTRREHAEVLASLDRIRSEALSSLVKEKDGYITVFNTTGFNAGGMIDVPLRAGLLSPVSCKGESCEKIAISDGRAYVKNIPPKGYVVFRVEEGHTMVRPSFNLSEDGRHIETPFYRVCFDENGRITSLFDKDEERECVREGGLFNELVMFEDKPMNYDNWDIDIYYTEKSWPVDKLISFSWDGKISGESTLTLEWRISNSTIKQHITFYSNTRRIDFRNEIDWHDHQCLLKTFFDTSIHTDEAVFDIQFGHIKRKTHTNTSWDRARFEVCGQKWADVGEARYGIALLNDAKYGYSARDGKLSLTLVKSGINPNPVADQGRQEFTYALFPHQNSWMDAGVVAEGYALNQKLSVMPGRAERDFFSYVSADRDNIVIETIKESEDGEGVVLRMYESINTRTRFTLTFDRLIRKAYLVNMLEENPVEVKADGKCVTLAAAGLEVLTLKVEFV